MCNLYSVTKGQSAIRDLFAVQPDRAGNLPPLPAIFPDQIAPIVRVGADGERELVMARWGMPACRHAPSRRELQRRDCSTGGDRGAASLGHSGSFAATSNFHIACDDTAFVVVDEEISFGLGDYESARMNHGLSFSPKRLFSNLMGLLLWVEPMDQKKRHSIAPLERFPVT